ncbi:MAG: anti-sigma factor family protein [Fidelibacterota bacterium]
MNCYEFRDQISAYIEKELSFPGVKQFDRHLETCDTCRDEYEGVVSVIQALQGSERFRLSDSFNAKLRSRLEGATGNPAQRFGRYFQAGRILGFEPRYAVLSAAALMAIIVLSVGLFRGGEGTPARHSIPLSTEQQLGRSALKTEAGLPGVSDAPLLSDESRDDSSEADLDVGRSNRPAFEGKIKLVKDQK